MSEMDCMLNERHLFHGTSQDVVEGICKHNFDPRVCGKHATMFGQGSYFARKAVYSHNFSKRSTRGVHYMFLAKVLTGKFTVGNPSMRRPPPLNPRDACSDLFDSCVDNWMDPQIFVIFSDDQSYPYFIIQYEEVGNTVAIWRSLHIWIPAQETCAHIRTVLEKTGVVVRQQSERDSWTIWDVFEYGSHPQSCMRVSVWPFSGHLFMPLWIQMGNVCMCVWSPSSVMDSLVCELCVWMSVSAVASMDDHGLEPTLVRGTSNGLPLGLEAVAAASHFLNYFPKSHRFHCCHSRSILTICSKL